MSRAAAVVRPATGGDVDALDALWDEIGELLGDGATGGAVQRLRRRVRSGDADQSVVVAWAAGTPVGLLTYAVVDPGPWAEVNSLVIGLLHVRDGSRHRGVARSLLAWAVARADEVGCADVAVQIPPSLREANRFFARFGFAPVATRRATPTAALSRRIATDPRMGRLVDLRRRRSILRRGVGRQGVAAAAAESD